MKSKGKGTRIITIICLLPKWLSSLCASPSHLTIDLSPSSTGQGSGLLNRPPSIILGDRLETDMPTTRSLQSLQKLLALLHESQAESKDRKWEKLVFMPTLRASPF